MCSCWFPRYWLSILIVVQSRHWNISTEFGLNWNVDRRLFLRKYLKTCKVSRIISMLQLQKQFMMNIQVVCVDDSRGKWPIPDRLFDTGWPRFPQRYRFRIFFSLCVSCLSTLTIRLYDTANIDIAFWCHTRLLIPNRRSFLGHSPLFSVFRVKMKKGMSLSSLH